VLAIATRQVYLSLAAGVWLGWTTLAGWNPLVGLARAIDATVAVLGDPGNARVIVFTLVIGSLIATMEAAGGVRGFVDWVEHRRWVDSPRRSRLLAWLLGIVIFIESNITVLMSGAVSRPLFDRHRVSREKLAYIIDSTSAPICILIPANAWGAYVLTILGTLGVESPVDVFLRSIPFNFYAIGAVSLAGFVAWTGFGMGPMRRADERVSAGQIARPGSVPAMDLEVIAPGPIAAVPPRARNMVVPVAVLVGMMPVGLWVTGGGHLTRGSGSTSVLWAVLAALAVTWLLLLAQKGLGVAELTRIGLKGAGGLVGLATVLLLALALAAVTREMGTGAYVAGLVQGVFPPAVLLPLVFVTAAAIAFATGTSWGTFAIILPISVPLALSLGLPVAPFLAASLSGGVFGDHASPISDTTIIASMASAVDHIDHVNTQLPYALSAGALAVVAFAGTGLLIG
jgi:tetracycline resistance efflux pump